RILGKNLPRPNVERAVCEQATPVLAGARQGGKAPGFGAKAGELDRFAKGANVDLVSERRASYSTQRQITSRSGLTLFAMPQDHYVQWSTSGLGSDRRNVLRDRHGN